MGARAILGFLLGAGGVFALAVFVRDCLPEPGDDIEWLRREDAVIVQMLTAEEGGSVLERRLAVPELTLYGDGTFIVKDDSATGYPLTQVTLDTATVQDLLNAIKDTGFLVFNYDQPRAESGGEVTYLYVNTKRAANAVRVEGLDGALPSGSEWTQLRSVQDIRARLDHIARDARDDTQAAPFVPDAIQEFTTTEGSTGVSERLIQGEEAERLAEVFLIGKGTEYVFVRDGLLVQGGYRPILPYEEHFPEFEQAP